MLNILYTLIIYPIQQIIELCYYFTLRVFDNPALALLGVSAAVSICTLPLYFRAEHWQALERDTQKRLAPKIAKIKAAFKGDEQYMILTTYYRQNHYHPVYALRNSLGVLIQIPFFIAAYHYLSHLDALRGAHFFIISDLSVPDTLIPFAGGGINILPILMTGINIVSGAIYTRGFPFKDKIQLYGMAAIFLVLLYNSPAGLVLYWTANNVFSLVKNILQKIPHSRKIVFAGLALLIIAADVFLFFFHPGDLPNRLLAMALFTGMGALTLIPRLANTVCIPSRFLQFRTFLLSELILFMLIGIVIPSSLIASSVVEFSFIDSFTTPFPFITQTALQTAGILLWATALYFLFSPLVKQTLILVLLIVSVLTLPQVFFVSEDFGFITNTLVFSDPKPFGANILSAALSIALCVIIPAALLALYIRKKQAVLHFLQVIMCIALACVSVVHLTAIGRDFSITGAKKESGAGASFEPVYQFSKNGNNVLLIMLDCIVGAYIPYVFEERPDLLDTFAPFTWYPNTVSFSNHTLVGALPVYGGYEYTPKAVNLRTDATLLDKQKEAYLLLPTIFANAGFSATVTDPPFDNFQMSNLSIFSADSRIHSENINGKYTAIWMQNHPEINTISISDLLSKRLIRFSFFRASPLFLRSFIYDDGEWLMLKDHSAGEVTPTILNDYAFLDILPDLTTIQSDNATYTAIYSHLPHTTTFLQPPDYTPTQTITDHGTSILKDDSRYHMTMASFIMLHKWFAFLKEGGVYDNIRIILASDHGRGNTNYPGNITLPNGGKLQSYNALLMVKDFDAKDGDALSVDDSFMTNADAALFAARGIAAENPFTGKTLEPVKENGVTITTIGALSTYRHSKYGYTISNDQWLHVHDTIFDPANWEKAE
ncbi:membrane protein [Spirochaetia bacterium]|nr:membrane protein [Spirochaetia bacterium]